MKTNIIWAAMAVTVLTGCGDKLAPLVSQAKDIAGNAIATVTMDPCNTTTVLQEITHNSGFYISDPVRGVSPVEGVEVSVASPSTDESMTDRVICKATVVVSGERVPLIRTVLNVDWTSDRDWLISETLKGWGYKRTQSNNMYEQFFSNAFEGLTGAAQVMSVINDIPDETDLTVVSFRSPIEYAITKGDAPSLMSWAWFPDQNPGYLAGRSLKALATEEAAKIDEAKKREAEERKKLAEANRIEEERLAEERRLEASRKKMKELPSLILDAKKELEKLMAAKVSLRKELQQREADLALFNAKRKSSSFALNNDFLAFSDLKVLRNNNKLYLVGRMKNISKKLLSSGRADLSIWHAGTNKFYHSPNFFLYFGRDGLAPAATDDLRIHLDDSFHHSLTSFGQRSKAWDKLDTPEFRQKGAKYVVVTLTKIKDGSERELSLNLPKTPIASVADSKSLLTTHQRQIEKVERTISTYQKELEASRSYLATKESI